MMTVNRALENSLLDAPVRVDVVLGEARIPVEELMSLSEGEIVELENQTTDLVDIYVSDRLMARGRLVVADGQLGVTLSEIVDSRQQSFA
ncbi:MAG: FliM/FliN family flagellar motor switch protein [Pseudomonadota bacterium]